jgi:hypothetical protein
MPRLRRHQRASFHPSVELLERRWVPTTLTPTTFADGGLGSGSLRDAVLQFNADTGTEDDIIQLLAGTYTLTLRNVGGHHETAGLTGDLNLTQTSHRWIIQGAGPSTIIDASQLQDRVFQIVNAGTQVVFQDLVIQGGLAQDDGSNYAFAGGDALGGGILNNGGNVTFENVVIQNNVARAGDLQNVGYPGFSARGGGVYCTGGALTISESILSDNQATAGRGGPGFTHGGVYTTLPGPGGNAQGGGLYCTGGALTITQSALANNGITAGAAGQLYSIGGHSYPAAGNGGAAQGGGLYALGGLLTFTDSTASANTSRAGEGGGLGYPYTQGGASYGGGLYVSCTAIVSNSTIAENTSAGGDGIVDAGPGQGGGLWVAAGATVQVSLTTFAANQAMGGMHGSLGGTDGAATGGGVYNSSLSTLTVSDSTLSGNSALLGIRSGGAIATEGANPVTLTNVTLTANRANYGSGLYVTAGPVILHNALIAGNFNSTGTTRSDVVGALNSGGDYNLIGDGTGMRGLSNGINGNLVGSGDAPIDPLVGPLQDNGGPTQTIALLPGGPALNAGDPNQLGTTDQRGVVRSGGVNIGAYQASATGIVVSAPNTVQSGLPFDVTVTAVDPYGKVAVGYTGTVTFTTSDTDPGVVLPADYTFTLADGGVHTFTDTGLGETTLVTAGAQTITATDTADNTITGSAVITVGSPAPGPVPGSGHRTAAPGPGDVFCLAAWSLHHRSGAGDPLAWDRPEGADLVRV